jgi:selenocysteine lyase/cysteine desulfurase
VSLADGSLGHVHTYLQELPNTRIATMSAATDAFPSTGHGEEDAKVAALRMDIVGCYAKFMGPFGEKPVCYVDWTASGRALRSIDKYIERNVLPLYGNTHTTTSITGYQSSCYRHEARQLIAEAVNAKVTGRASVDVVLFTGNGTTAAVNKLVDSLSLQFPLPEVCVLGYQ